MYYQGVPNNVANVPNMSTSDCLKDKWEEDADKEMRDETWQKMINQL